MGLISTAAGDVITTVFPGECRVCGGVLVEAWGAPVCGECRDGLRRRVAPACWRCGDFLNVGLDMEDLRFRGMECLACRMAPPEFERAVCFGSYQDELREMIHLLKYERVTGLAGVLGGRLAEAVAGLEGEASGELLVVAVPLFARAERARGFNQARVLADAMVKRLRATRPEWRMQAAHGALRRVKSTANQFELSRRERRRNLAGAFALVGNVSGREVLLIDDVLTTGATARECARVLRRGGAAKVWVATVARACGADERFEGDRAGDPGAYVAGWDL